MDFEKRLITDLVYAEYNPRKQLTEADEEYQKIKRSLQEFGYVDPVIINSDNTIIGGHQRVTVLRDLGYKEIDVVVVDMDKTKEKALNIALNKITGEWDFNKLEALLAELHEEMDASITGFDDSEISQMLDSMKTLDADDDGFNEADALEEVTEPETKQGDIYLLGQHRLMCGDSTNEADVKKLMNGRAADLLLTDPPYNVDIKNSKDMKIINDNMDSDSFRKFLIDAFKAADAGLKEGASYYIWHADSEGLNFRSACEAVGWKVRQCLIWNKNTFSLGRQDYQWKHEPCLYGWKDGAAHYFVDDRTQSTVINEDKPAANSEHPTMKPIKLVSRLIKNSSRQNELVLDVFGGSGSTMIACEQLNRSCYMMELDPKYCDVIINRWEKFTGQKAEKIS
ncbi:MAG: site-specific DNA-methyltransferase [Lentihominibacter sp.]